MEINPQIIDAGICVPGLHVKHPLTGEQLPIFITSYVSADYGSGAVMGVPSHCDNDRAFAIKNNITGRVVLSEDDKTLVNSG